MTDTLIDLIADSIPSGQHWLSGHGPAYYSDLADHPQLKTEITRAWLWMGDARESEAFPAVLLSVVRRKTPVKDWRETCENIPMRVFADDKSGPYQAFSPIRGRVAPVSEII